MVIHPREFVSGAKVAITPPGVLPLEQDEFVKQPEDLGLRLVDGVDDGARGGERPQPECKYQCMGAAGVNKAGTAEVQ